MASKLILTLLLFASSFSYANLEEFQIEDLQKNKIEFHTPFVLVYFWATWCPDCKDGLKSKLPSISGPDISIVTVNTDARAEKVLDYLKTEKVNFPTLLDSEKVFRKKYSVFSVPTALIFKRDKEHYVLSNTLTGADLEKIRESLKRE